jgi:hypothetical protein
MERDLEHPRVDNVECFAVVAQRMLAFIMLSHYLG